MARKDLLAPSVSSGGFWKKFQIQDPFSEKLISRYSSIVQVWETTSTKVLRIIPNSACNHRVLWNGNVRIFIPQELEIMKLEIAM